MLKTGQQKEWWQGGTLHNSTIEEWKKATLKNKVATCAGWLNQTLWKGYTNTDNLEKLRVRSLVLATSIDLTIKGGGFEKLKRITGIKNTNRVDQIALMQMKLYPENFRP